MDRRIYVSPETKLLAQTLPNKRVEIYSFFPCDRADCACVKAIYDFNMKRSKMNAREQAELVKSTKFIQCPRDKTGMDRYRIICKNCNQVQGYCWATDETLKDWCDFHYTLWTHGDYWRGCFTPHISPITQELCLECCCGMDTRDFRANMILPIKKADRLERHNKLGRGFGYSDSKFVARKFSSNVLI